MARPHELTPEVQAKIVGLIERGNFPETACAVAGISGRTFYNWQARGRAGEEPFVQFLRDIERARAVAEAESVNIVRESSFDDPKQAAWLLERRNGERWASKIRVTVEQELNAALDKLAREFADEPHTLDRIFAALSSGPDLSLEAVAVEAGAEQARIAAADAADEPARRPRPR